MSKATFNPTVSRVVVEQTASVTLELTLTEAHMLLALASRCNGNILFSVYTVLGAALSYHAPSEVAPAAKLPSCIDLATYRVEIQSAIDAAILENLGSQCSPEKAGSTK